VTSSIEASNHGHLGPGFAEVIKVVNQASAFGTATSDNGAHMYGHVPHVAPHAWLHTLFPALDADSLVEVERDLRRPVPSSYQELLRQTNGLYLFRGALSLYGRRRDYSRKVSIREPFDLADPNVHERPRAAHPSWFIFGFYNEDGSSAYIDPSDGHVYRANRDMTSPRLNQWASLDAFLGDEVRRLERHFDDRGRQLDPSRPTTPGPDIHSPKNLN
jgi:SMI1 / KNR4 family (SUKH-1)